MSGPAPVELSADCEHCFLEGGVIEIYDPLVAACRFGLPASTSCKLCGARSEGLFSAPPIRELREVAANRCPGCDKELSPAAIDSRRCDSCGADAKLVSTTAPTQFGAVDDLARRLDEWAERDGFDSRDKLIAATFVETDISRLFARISSRARLEIVADPFANMGVRTTSGRSASTHAASPPQPPPPAPSSGVDLARSVPPPASAPPRALVYPLVSVIAADGEIHPEERALVDRFLQSEGLPPLAEEEFRVHAPLEVARFVPKNRREDVVRLMCESACCDGAPDESEKRVIMAYASAWDVDSEKVDFWIWGYESMNTSLARQLFLKLRRFVLSARWSPDTLAENERDAD